MSTNPTGFLITFEGGEGAGKSTQVAALARNLFSAGMPFAVTREPGAGRFGAAIRALLLDSAPGEIPDRAEALLYAADRVHHVYSVLQPMVNSGRIVLCDRYQDSSIAYQGYGRSLDPQMIADISHWATCGLLPDLVVVLDIDPRQGLARARNRGPADRIEQEHLDFHERVRAGFLVRAAENPQSYLVVDATLPVDELTETITARVMALLGADCALASTAAQPAEPAGQRRTTCVTNP